MRRTINVGHRGARFTLVIVITIAAAGAFGKPGALLQQVFLWPTLKQTQPEGEWRRSGSLGLVTQLSACLPCSDVAGPLGRAHFLLCQTSCTTPCCALPSVHLGLFLGHLLWQGLTARELVEGPPVPSAPPSLPPTLPLPAPVSSGSHSPPRSSLRAWGPQAQCKRHVSSQLVTVLTASVDALSSLPLGYKIAFPLSSCISPPRPTPPPLSLWKWGSGTVTQRKAGSLTPRRWQPPAVALT